jgi:hypothetical protein
MTEHAAGSGVNVVELSAATVFGHLRVGIDDQSALDDFIDSAIADFRATGVRPATDGSQSCRPETASWVARSGHLPIGEGARERLRSFLLTDWAATGIGYSEFFLRAVEQAGNNHKAMDHG